MTDVEAAKRVLLGKTCDRCAWQEQVVCASYQREVGKKYGTCLSFQDVYKFPISKANTITNSGRIYPKSVFSKITLIEDKE